MFLWSKQAYIYYIWLICMHNISFKSTPLTIPLQFCITYTFSHRRTLTGIRRCLKCIFASWDTLCSMHFAVLPSHSVNSRVALSLDRCPHKYICSNNTLLHSQFPCIHFVYVCGAQFWSTARILVCAINMFANACYIISKLDISQNVHTIFY